MEDDDFLLLLYRYRYDDRPHPPADLLLAAPLPFPWSSSKTSLLESKHVTGSLEWGAGSGFGRLLL